MTRDDVYSCLLINDYCLNRQKASSARQECKQNRREEKYLRTTKRSVKYFNAYEQLNDKNKGRVDAYYHGIYSLRLS